MKRSSQLSTIVLWSMLGFVVWAAVGCSEPIIRKDPEMPDPLPGPTISQNANMPDLKKRLWIIPFRVSAALPEAFAKTPLGAIVQSKLITAFSEEKGPYLPQNTNDENAFLESKFDADSRPEDVARFLRGSDISGFVTGNIESLVVDESGGDEEGFFKSKTYRFNVTMSFELYDSQTGRRVASGKEIQKYSENRSEVLGFGFQLAELPKRFDELATSAAAKIYQKSTPFAEKLAWSGRVLRIEGGRVYINAGRKTGVLVGDNLRVVEVPKEIHDNEAGTYVGLAPGRMKATVKVIQYFGVDGAIAVLQTGGGIYPDDRVELY